MSTGARQPQHRQAGMVLIAVLWIVAALSIAVTGLTRSVRQEAALLGVARSNLQATALGEAAIALALQQMVAAGKPAGEWREAPVQFQGQTIGVSVAPLTGLIDINAAPPALLAKLYTVAGGLPPAAAETLAQATVAARERRDARGVPARFEAPEDLLQVPGFGYDLYARLAGLITADLRGSGRVNPLAAPPGVLAVLANGNQGVVDQIAGARRTGGEGIDMTALDGNFVQQTAGRQLRMVARVPNADGSAVEVLRDVDLTPDRRSGAPWQIFHASERAVPAPTNP